MRGWCIRVGACLVSGCFVDPSSVSNNGDGSDSTTASVDTTSTSGVATQGSTTETSDESTRGTTSLATGDSGSEGSSETTTGPPGGCSELDLLFVVDNSASMSVFQAGLIEAFAGPVASAGATAGVDVHVGVTTTDAYAGNTQPCQAIGSLVVRTAGPDSSNAMCGPWSAGNFMGENDDLAEGFTCAAAVGTFGSGNERPMEALLTVADLSLADAGECNEGFLRPDSLFAVVMLTDEPDQSGGNPQIWFDAMTAARGEANHVVVGALTIPVTTVCPNPNGLAEEIVEFAEMFEYNLVGDICVDSYDAFAAEFGALLATSCADF